MSSLAVAAAVAASEKRVVRVLVLPVLQRSWVFHAWTDPSPAATETQGQAATHAAAQAVQRFKSSSVQERWSQTMQGLKARFDSTVATQWRELQAAKEGSFRSYLHKLAQLVLSREDPAETFLKAVPKGAEHVQIIYPASVPGRLVRRRLRHLVLQRLQEHRWKLFGWGLVTLPQVPLILTPLPNVTVYYSIYRYVSHLQAMHGANVLKSAFEVSDAQQMMHTYSALRDSKLQYPDDQVEAATWRSSFKARALASKENKCKKFLSKNDATGTAPSVVYEASALLEQITQPAERYFTPLSDEAVHKISQHYGLPDLAEHCKRARNRAARDGKGGQGQAQGQTVYRLTRDHYAQARKKKTKEGQHGVYNHV